MDFDSIYNELVFGFWKSKIKVCLRSLVEIWMS